MYFKEFAANGMPFHMEKPDYNQLLISIAENRCENSFAQLFNDFAPKIYSFALKKKMSEFQAKEVVQNVMTTVWLKADLFNGEKGSAKTWIFTITRNKCFDLFRKDSSDQKVFSSEDFWPEVVGEDSNLEEDWSDLQSHKKLREAVGQLPESQKKAITAVFLQEMTHQEYSDKSGIPLGTVKSQIRLAMKKLKRSADELY